MQVLPKQVSWKTFFKDLKREFSADHATTGAAALGFYLTLAIFPALLALLAVVPYLPIQNVDAAIMDLLRQALPAQAADLLTQTVESISSNKKAGLLSFSLLGTLWAASSGTQAVMQQLNIAYDVREERSFVRSRLTAIGLTLLLGLLVITAFVLIVLGGQVQDWILGAVGGGGVVRTFFAVARWGIIVAAVLLAFSVAYYLGPNVEQKFRFVTPGSVIGTVILIAASLGFRLYIQNFGNYNATYGSIGAVIVLMLWLYVTGLVLILGSEINSVIEHYHPEGREKPGKFSTKKGDGTVHRLDEARQAGRQK